MRIGVFDSGLGGLTVVKEIIRLIPKASIIYVGDTARVPYGSKGKPTIIRYSKEIVSYLLKRKVDAIVVACNTVSSVAMNELNKMTNIPIVDMIKPAVLEAIKKTKNNKITVIGTRATVNSGAYKKEISKINHNIMVYEKACPLFVPIVEEGLAKHEITKIIISEYLSQKNINKSDTLILGCTHYPMLKNQIQKILTKDINLISCGKPAAEMLYKIFNNKKMTKANYEFLVTDDPNGFRKLAEKFLGKKIKKIKLLTLVK